MLHCQLHRYLPLGEIEVKFALVLVRKTAFLSTFSIIMVRIIRTLKNQYRYNCVK